MSYINTLKPEAKKNAEILVKRMNAKGITNPNSQAGLLSIVSKESGFMPRNETSYANTSNQRIRDIFGSRITKYTDAQLDTLKKNDEAFYDAIYGMTTKVGQDGGNTSVGDGYLYRGRGFNGITFKSGYKKYGDILGIDLVKNPDKLNEIEVSADAVIEYFKANFLSRANKLKDYNSTGINDFKSVTDSTGAYYHANAGWGKDTNKLKNDTTGGYNRAMQRSTEFLEYVKNFTGQTIDLAKKK